MIRAENAYGVSVPSEMSEVIETLGEKLVLTEQMLAEARLRLNGKVIILKELIAETSTSIKVAWEVSHWFFFFPRMNNWIYVTRYFYANFKLKWIIIKYLPFVYL